jgi:hypothetical protein
LPPLTLGPDRATIFVMIFPFMEQGSLYNTLDQGPKTARPVDCGSYTHLGCSQLSNFQRLAEADRDAVSSIKFMTCKSRRSGVQRAPIGAQYDGPLNDYAVPIVWDNKRSGAGTWWLHLNPCDIQHYEPVRSAFRAARVECNGTTPRDDYAIAHYRPRDNMARIQAVDGSSNSIIMGEKHIRAGEFGSCCSDDRYVPGADGPYLYENSSMYYTASRSARLPIANGPKDFDGQHPSRPQGGPREHYGFGGWHPGVCLFLLGDGSVRPIQSNFEINSLRSMCDVEDGVVVDFD